MDAPTHIAQDIPHTHEVLEALMEQCPQWTLMSSAPIAQGWDNLTYPLTCGAALRLPRRAASTLALQHELKWLPRLESHLPLPIPRALYVGHPTPSFPHSWAVVPWMEGAPWGALHPTAQEEHKAASQLAIFLKALHTLSVAPDAPQSPLRGGLDALRRRKPLVEAGLKTLKRSGRVEAHEHQLLASLWQDALMATPPSHLTWCHGDLHPFNIIASNGQLSSIIDWGDVTAGDPALDLYGLWMMFDVSARQAFRSEARHLSEDAWIRGKGWALALSLLLAHVYRKQPAHPFALMASTSLKRLAYEHTPCLV